MAASKRFGAFRRGLGVDERREGRRHEARFRMEADAQRRSWMFLEKTRAIHDVALLAMAGTMLTWAVTLWSRGRATSGDVVIGRRDEGQRLRSANCAFVNDATDPIHVGSFSRIALHATSL